jgi:prolyl oligopeptidase
MTPMQYPETRRTEETDERAGVTFPDPYHWLEANSEQVRDWQRAQGALAAEHVRQWPHFDALKRSVARFSVARFASVPRHAGGRWFRIAAPKGSTRPQALVADSPTGEGRVVFDPASENPTSSPFLSWISPSPNGLVLALGVCADGSENNTIRLIDVATGEQLRDPPTHVLMDNWLAGAQWRGDSSGFFYTALTGSTHDFRQAIFFYRLGDPSPVEPAAVPVPESSRDYSGVIVSRCGCWAVASHRLQTPAPVALLNLHDPEGEWRPFITNVAHTVAGHVVGNRYVAVTDVDAPRGRLVAIALDCTDPNNPANWEEILPQSEAVMRSVTPVGGYLYLNEFVDTYARVRIFGADGTPLGEISLPGKGAIAELPFPIMNLFPKGATESFLFGFSTLVSSWGIYRHWPGEASIETLSEPEVRVEGAVIEDHWAVSADGTRIPYHAVRLAQADLTKPRPTLLYAYGGFNAPWIPQFPGAMAAFIAAGGVFVHGHLRGGGEFGLHWWRDGRLKNKQNGYADLYAIAEDLIGRGVTRSDLLGVTGGSNGGLMAGVAITQRPELWRVAIPRVPLLDIIGAFRDPYGSFACRKEFGDPDDPIEVRRMAAFSPYQLVKSGTVYPATFIDAGDTDPRCPPWHARKFAAQLQAAQAGSGPILLHIWENVGHGWATDKDVQVEENTEWIAFAMQILGMIPADHSLPRARG